MSKLDFEQIIKQIYDEGLNALRVTDGGGGGGASYPEVNAFANLPSPAALPGAVYLVKNPSGIWPFTRKQSGLYFSNGSSWSLLNALTPADILSMYESNADVNRFANADKAAVGTAVQSGVNLGTGASVLSGKNLTNLEFKTIVAGANITLTPAANSITISSSGGGGASSSNNYMPAGWV